jgi:hypothetical protein
VDDVLLAAPALVGADGVLRREVGVPVADGDAADRVVLLRDPEVALEARPLVGLDADQARADPLVDGREQHAQGCHAGVDVPERDRPLLDAARRLLRPGVALPVGRPALREAGRRGAQGCVQHPLNDLGRARLVGVVAHHPAPARDLSELHW